MNPEEIRELIKVEVAEAVKNANDKLIDTIRQILTEELSKAEDNREKLKKEVSEYVGQKVINGFGGEIRSEIKNQMNQQLVAASEVQRNQLELVKAHTKEIVLAVGTQIQKNVYGQIINSLNETIVPKVNNMIELVHYNMQDGAEVVTEYRKAFERQVNPSIKMITDGTVDKRIISEHVRTFYAESDSDEDL